MALESVNSTSAKNTKNFAIECIRELKEKYPNFSSSQIAKTVGMSQSTFCRIENGMVNASVNSISALLTALGKTHKIADAIELTYPEFADSLKRNFSHNQETPIASGKHANYFNKSDFRKIILLASTRSGTTRAEVQEEFGRSGLKDLEELISETVLSEIRGIIKVDEEKISYNQSSLRDALLDCIDSNYQVDKFGLEENWLSFQTESVNKDKAMKLIREKLKTAYSEIKSEILYSPEYFGNDKVFIGMVADSLLNCEQRNKEVNQ